MNKRSIATVSLSGALDEKLRAIAAAGFDAVEIFENDLLSFSGSPRDVGQMCRDLGLSPLMVQQTFNILKDLRDRGVSILMIEQNARSALEISDIGIVLELGQTRMVDKAERILNDPRIGQLFLGGAMEDNAA